MNAVAPQAPTTNGAKPAAKTFGLTAAAAARIQKLRDERQTPEAGLRVAVRGGGCSGLTYVIEWAEAPRERDKLFERDGVRVFVDPKSYLYLMGSVLNYEETLMASGFRLENPLVKTACGCGESFSI
ncbi:MAG: HesB/IscA family protein [Myxococcaceae bacterium]